MTTLTRTFCTFLIMAFITTPFLYAQDNMGVGTQNPNPNAILELSAQDKGFLAPRMDTTQRNNIPTGNTENGLLIYANNVDKFFYWNATQAEWVPIPSSSSDNQNMQGSGFASSTNDLTIDIQNGSSETVDLSALDQPNTDNQDLLSSSGFSSSTNQLNIDIQNGQNQTVDLSSLDNAGGFWNRDAGNGYLYPSNLNDNVGIGTSSPNNAILQVDGVTSERMAAIKGDFNNESGIVRTMIVKNNGHTSGLAKYRGLQLSSQGDSYSDGRTQALLAKAEGRDLNAAVYGQLDNDVNDPTTSSGNTTGTAILGEDKNKMDPTYEGLTSNRYAGFFTGDLKVIDGRAIKTGNTSWTSASDKRLKKNVHPYEQGLDKIMKIEPVNFQYNEKSGHNTENEYVGVIAQGLLDIAPYMVSTYQKGDKEYYNVNNSAMTYMLINAVQQQHKTNKTLKEKLQSQQKQINQLREAVHALQDEEKSHIQSKR